MCGFAGIIFKRNQWQASTLELLLSSMGQSLQHRGPDDSGIFIGDRFGVVHRRLSIVDIAAGQQPMYSRDQKIGIAYNGEIYNYLELRDNLIRRGYHFSTHCDTEVVLRLYEEFGESAFNQLDGMFALFIWDTRNDPQGKFLLARDHLGIKPLYIYEDEIQIVFASELRSILQVQNLDLSLDPYGVQDFLNFRYCHAPRTFFRSIRRVEAGTLWQVRGNQTTRYRYWDLDPTQCSTSVSEVEAKEKLYDLLLNSVKQQLMGEVPIGILLSGGLDSSIVAYFCHQLDADLTTFNVGFPDLNEFQYSRRMAKAYKLRHVEVTTTPQEIAERFDLVIGAMDEPIADPACFPLHILCDQVKKQVTVVLSGEGSDELLAGYPQYRQIVDDSPAPSHIKFEQFLQRSWYFAHEESLLVPDVDLSALLRHRSYFQESSLLNGMLCYDLKTWLPENLMMKADKIMMSHSLEGRFPFLARSIVEFTASLPESLKYSNGISKRLLRETFHERLPTEIIERPKMGFSVPVDMLVKQSQSRLFDTLEFLRKDDLAQVLDLDKVRTLVENYYSGCYTNTLRIWTILVLVSWFSQFRKSTPKPADLAYNSPVF
jgi:asparagine synthase (glutamine-hydrolysing)